MVKASTELTLRFLKYYLLGVISICQTTRNRQAQIKLIESYAKMSLDLMDELLPDDEDEDPNSITREI